MPPRKYDWEGLTRKYVARRQGNLALTYEQFYREEGLPKRLARKRLGRMLKEAWEKVEREARDRVVKKAGQDLSEEVMSVLKVSRSLMAQGVNATLGKGVVQGTGKRRRLVKLQPGKYGEAVDAIHVGGKGVIESVKTLTGGEPLVSAKGRRIVVEWVPGQSQSRPKKRR